MTRFTLTGKRGGATVSITWEDGDLTGDPDAVAMVEDLAAAYEGRLMGQSGGPYTMRDHLASPYSACELMHMVFDGLPKMQGALPSIPKPPRGAVR